MGMDGLVVDPASRGRTRVFVVALGGKDYADARLTDAASTLRAMAGATGSSVDARARARACVFAWLPALLMPAVDRELRPLVSWPLEAETNAPPPHHPTSSLLTTKKAATPTCARP